MLSPRKPSLLAYVNVSLERPQYLGDGPEYCTKGQNRLRTGYNVRKTAVYALGGNALQSPGGGSQDAAEVLARVMSDVIDLLEKDWSVVLTAARIWSWKPSFIRRHIQQREGAQGRRSEVRRGGMSCNMFTS